MQIIFFKSLFLHNQNNSRNFAIETKVKQTDK